MEKCSPFAVGLPWWNDPYHEAHPTCPLRDNRASAGAVVAANQRPRSVRQSMVARMMVTRTSTLHGGKGHVSSSGNDVMTWGRLLEDITWFSLTYGSDAMWARWERSQHNALIFHEEPCGPDHQGLSRVLRANRVIILFTSAGNEADRVKSS